MSSLADEVTTIAFESLAVDAHASFIVNASASEDTLEHAFTEHLRLSGIYWGVCALATMGNLRKTMDADKREEILRPPPPPLTHRRGGGGEVFF